MRRILYVTGIVVGLFLLSTCTLKNPTNPKLPSWMVNLEFPLLKDHVTLKEIAEDSLITTEAVTGSPEDSLFVFKDSVPIDSVEVGNQLNINDIHKHFTQTVDDVTIESDQKHDEVGFDEVRLDDVTKSVRSEVGPIELNDTDPVQSRVFAFRDIMPSDLVATLEDSIDANGGSYTSTIPARTLTTQNDTIEFTAFQNVDLQDGELILTIHNDMFIRLGEPINVELELTDGTAIGQAVFTPHIQSGSDQTQPIDLAGKTLESEMVIIITGESDGSDGDKTITHNNLDTGFYVEVTVQNLVATEADAQIPSQQITQDKQIELAESENKIEEATLQTGSLDLTIANNLSVNSFVTLRVPSMVDSGTGEVFQPDSFEVPANSTVNKSFSIAGQTMVMDTANQVVNYNYEVNTVDTGNEYRVINQNDSVNVQVDLAGMTISSILGVLEPKRTVEDGDIPITSDNDILEATIGEGEMTLNINNRIGGDPDLRLVFHQIFESPGSSDTLIRDIDINPGQNTAVIDLGGREIRMPRDDQTLYYTTITDGGGVYAEYDITDSISVDIEISELLITEATGYFTQDAMVEEDTIALDNETKVETAVIDSGQLQLRIVNNIGVAANVRLILDEFYSPAGDQLDTTLSIPETDEPTVRTIPLNAYEIQMPLDDQKINYTSQTRLLQDEQMTLSLEDSISVDVDITGLSFSEVTGEIEPVNIDIAPVEQDVSGIPNELEGVKFNEVNMAIDFETNIGIPVFLDLTIKSYNSEGDTVINDAVRGWNINPAFQGSSTVVIPNAEDLINIFPSAITASGQATAGAPGEIGTVASNQFVFGQLNIAAPLEFEITNDAVVNLDPQKVDPIEEDVRNRVRRLTLYARMENQFEFGAQVHVISAKDTLTFDGGTSQIPDTLAVLDVPAGVSSLDSVDLDTSKIGLFRDSSYVKTRVKMLPMPDGSPSSFLSTDTLHMNLYGKVQYLNDHLKE